MTAGPLLPNVLAFTVPLILSGVLQLLYNSADIIVVGRFADSVAMASVGATTSLIQLLVSMLMGLSVGASVAVARAAGAGALYVVSLRVHAGGLLRLLDLFVLLEEKLVVEELLGGDDRGLGKTLVIARNLDLLAVLEGLLHGVRGR